MKFIQNWALTFGLNFAYTAIAILIAFAIQDRLEQDTDRFSHIMIFFLACGPSLASFATSNIKTLVFSIMGYQTGLLLAVMIVGMSSVYSIDWTMVWMLCSAQSAIILAMASPFVIHRQRQQARTSFRTEGVSPSTPDPTA